MNKSTLRTQVWDDLEESGVARFPFPPHDRIPNFAGADAAAQALQNESVWKHADVLKANPDAPQLPVRRAALRAGKTVYMAVPRLADRACFLRLDPEEIQDIDAATTVSGAPKYGISVGPEAVETIDLVVSGSVAVTPSGVRVGKGEGYSDLEFAILQAFDVVDDSTPTVTTVHERQIVEEELSPAPWDVPMELIVTPDRTLETTPSTTKPTGIDWDALDEDRIAEIPVLQELRDRD